jgi:hypothetical protein
MKIITCLLLTLCLNTYAADLSFISGLKDDQIMVGVKAYIFKLETSSNHQELYELPTVSISKESHELNLAIEPEIILKRFDDVSISFLPLVGISKTTTTTHNRSLVGAECTLAYQTANGKVGEGCVSEKTSSETTLYNGASLGLNYQPDNTGVSLNIGAYSNSRKLDYKPQVTVGFSFKF